ncbi:glyoxalase [Gordonia spumicola]|uniref:Glyoxalase n=1 Tax=Gordonia spumicola TaxID=589161 RepID=A0A7I9V8Y5_9ACTN|nr:glyoxalase [Gordonia spumicola]GEE01755.1 glyoxalase [Gordonia spumicola]
MTNIDALTIAASDADAARTFYDAAFGLGDRLRVEQSAEATSGFRGFAVSLVVADSAVVDSFFDSAVAAGARVVKPASKSLWGYGATVEAPDGTVWTLASSKKKPTGAPPRVADSIVLLLGVDDVAATKEFYVGKGLTVAKSFGRKYVEFEAGGAITLAVQSRKATAKNAGVGAEGSGSHRLTVVSDVDGFVDPDGYVWA